MYIENAIAVFENCHVLHSRLLDNAACILTFNSTTTVKSSHIANLRAGWFLQVNAGGRGTLTDVTFVNCSSQEALIVVFQESSLTVDNCTYISNNNSFVHVQNSSLVIIRNLLFSNNTILSKAIVGSYIRSLFRSVLLIKQSHFFNNTVSGDGVAGHGVIGLDRQSIGIMESCDFIKNKGRVIGVFNALSLVVTLCNFHGNIGACGGTGIHMFVEDSREHQTENVQDSVKHFTARTQQDTGSFIQKTLSGARIMPRWDITNCTFVGNTAEWGGAIAAENISLYLAGNHFVNNSAVGPPASGLGDGGAVWLQQSSANMTQCLFDGNSAVYGGGISFSGELLFIHLSNFSENEAGSSTLALGGAIFFRGGERVIVLISSSVFLENKAQNAGGAIAHLLVDGVLTIEGSTFCQNSAESGGAILCPAANIINSTFETNAAESQGGAMVLDKGRQSNISFCNFTSNTAVLGGAIHAGNNASLTCHMCVFHNNAAVSRWVSLNFLSVSSSNL